MSDDQKPIDYRDLLWRYMQVVKEAEGVTFADGASSTEFSRAELDVLEQMDHELSEQESRRYNRC